jgi:NhaA family Na+:H+ antiporter
LLTSRIAWGIVAGLVIGKPLGILSFARGAVRAGLAEMPHGVTWKQINACGLLAGIGFTVSIFISSLAFDNATQLMEAKAAVLGASIVAGVLGYLTLRDAAAAGQVQRAEIQAESTTAGDSQ